MIFMNYHFSNDTSVYLLIQKNIWASFLKKFIIAKIYEKRYNAA